MVLVNVWEEDFCVWCERGCKKCKTAKKESFTHLLVVRRLTLGPTGQWERLNHVLIPPEIRTPNLLMSYFCVAVGCDEVKIYILDVFCFLVTNDC